MQRFMNALMLAILLTAIASWSSANAENTNKLKTGDKVLLNLDATGLALKGYDPVAYFKLGKSLMGNPQSTTLYQGALYQFASPGNQIEFERDPAKYAPQFGGFCGYGVSQNHTAPIDPNAFLIQDGRLILNHDAATLELFKKDTAGNVAKADQNWPGLVEKEGSKQKNLVSVDKEGIGLKGYDPVAYFKTGATKGNPAISTQYHGATYRFASEENKKEFESNPDHYEPAYGGYCGYAASVNKLAPIDPEVFQIANGRLILQYSKSTYDKFNKELGSSVSAADKNWHGLVEKNYGKPQGGLLSGLGF